MAADVTSVLNAVFVSLVTPRSLVPRLSQMNVELAAHLSMEENHDESENTDAHVANFIGSTALEVPVQIAFSNVSN